jgi:hypothetical protein
MLDRGLAMRVGLNGSSFKSVTSPGDNYFFEKVLQVVNPALIAPNVKVVKEQMIGISNAELSPKVYFPLLASFSRPLLGFQNR